jgi:hypothetical protein
MEQVFSSTSVSSASSLVHWMLNISLSSGVGEMGPLVADVSSTFSPTPLHELIEAGTITVDPERLKHPHIT